MRHYLYSGHIYHSRSQPVQNSFRYRVFSLLLDIDHLEEAENRLFKINRRGLWSFYNKDHGSHIAASLRPWVESKIDFVPVKIKLLCFPRLMGYVFNPLSVYFCYDNSGLKAVIYQVRNAYKQQHTYIASIDDAAPHKHGMQKQFYVSPYTPESGYYKMALTPPAAAYFLKIELFDTDDQLVLLATHQGKQQAFTASKLLRYSFQYLFLSFKIPGAILWQALKLRLKGLKFKKPSN